MLTTKLLWNLEKSVTCIWSKYACLFCSTYFQAPISVKYNCYWNSTTSLIFVSDYPRKLVKTKINKHVNHSYKWGIQGTSHLIWAHLTWLLVENVRNWCWHIKITTNMSSSIPLKRDMVAGVTVLTLGSGGSSFLMLSPFDTAGLLSMMATFKCFVNGIFAKAAQE